MRDRERSLQAIGDVIDYWIKWVSRNHEAEGIAITPDTSVMLGNENAPPHWPSIGQLTLWLKVIRETGD